MPFYTITCNAPNCNNIVLRTHYKVNDDVAKDLFCDYHKELDMHIKGRENAKKLQQLESKDKQLELVDEKVNSLLYTMKE